MTVDLSTRYLGLTLNNPLVASSSPLTGNTDSLRRLEDAGVAAVVLPSLFAEQIEHDEIEMARLYENQTDSFAEALDFFPELEVYNTGSDNYLARISQAKSALSLPVIASLNASSLGGWIDYARQIEQEGADALELNIYIVATDVQRDALQVENDYVELVTAVRREVTLPISVKIGPFFSALPQFALRLVKSGADGLVLFNRYLEPDIDLDTLEFNPDLVLSRREELRLPLRWIAILRDHLTASLAATSGIHDANDALKALLVGADVTMLTSALLKNGPSHLVALKSSLLTWMEENEYESVEQMKGSMSKQHAPNPEGLERANYMQALTRFSNSYWIP